MHFCETFNIDYICLVYLSFCVGFHLPAFHFSFSLWCILVKSLVGFKGCSTFALSSFGSGQRETNGRMCAVKDCCGRTQAHQPANLSGRFLADESMTEELAVIMATDSSLPSLVTSRGSPDKEGVIKVQHRLAQETKVVGCTPHKKARFEAAPKDGRAVTLRPLPSIDENDDALPKFICGWPHMHICTYYGPDYPVKLHQQPGPV